MSNPNTTPAEDGFDFVRKMWGNMGFGLPGMVTPTLDADELERRITDLKAVENWLKINLNMLQMSIQGLEVQRSTLVAMRAMSQAAHDAPDAPNPFANPALWPWPFSTTQASATSETPQSSAESPAAASGTPQQTKTAKKAAPRA